MHTARTVRGLALAAIAALAGCGEAGPPAHLRVAGGDVERGQALVASLGCGACHTISEMRGARGIVGPPLDDYAQRIVLAGHYPNAPRTLIPFLIDPPAMRPGTAMPSLGLDERQARDIAAYLYSLGAGEVQIYPPEPALDLVAPPGRPPAPALPALGAARP